MRKLFIFILLIFLAPGVLADSAVDYTVFDNKALVDFFFEQAQDLELRLPLDVRALEVSSDFEIEDFDRYKVLKVDSAESLNIKYITDSLVDRSGKKYFFVARSPVSEVIDVRLFLPEGAVLTDDVNRLVVPEADEITSDGRRIILHWEDFNDEQIVVAYEFVEEVNIAALILLLVVFGLAVFYMVKRPKRKLVRKVTKAARKRATVKKKKEFTRNLFGEERKIVEYLLGKRGRGCWTKELVKDLGISKVRLSRRLRSLEQKGLIEKIPYGTENRIKLIRMK